MKPTVHRTIESLINDYYTFLKEKTVIQSDGLSGWIQISTPMLDVYNDSIDLYAKQQNGNILLSDDGQTLRNLDLNGVSLSRSHKRKQLIKQILLNYGVHWNNESNELLIEANEKNFPQRKLNLLSAIVETNNLYFLSENHVASVFSEDVKAYLDEQEIIYTPHFISRGSTGLEFTFDFQIASRKLELVIKAFSTINSMNLPHFLFAWEDIKKVREQQTGKQITGLAIINDIKEIKPEYLEALRAKKAKYMLWSQRHTPENVGKLQLQAA